MGNTQSVLQDGENQAKSRKHGKNAHARDDHPVITKHRPGHLYSHSISLATPSSAENSDSEASETIFEEKTTRAHVIVAGSSYGRYGGSDMSLVEPDSATDQDSGPSLSSSDIESIYTDSGRNSPQGLSARRPPVSDIGIKTDAPHIEVAPDAPTPRAVSGPANAPHTPRAEQRGSLVVNEPSMPSHALRRSFLFNDEALMTLPEPTMERNVSDSGSEEEPRNRRSSKISALPSYLKIPTAIPRSYTSAHMAQTAANAAAAEENAPPSTSSSTELDTASQDRDSPRLVRAVTVPHLHFSSEHAVPVHEHEHDPAELHDMAHMETDHMLHSPELPLTPLNLIWRGKGQHVYVTGTFADEWRSKIPLRQIRPGTPFLCTLYLPPGTHRLKFVVDNRWRVSHDLHTATDGDGTLVNYVEIPNPCEPDDDRVRLDVHRDEAWKRAMAELRSSTANPRGEWDVLDEIPGHAEGAWTSEVPPSIEVAQEAEEQLAEQELEPEASSLLPAPPQLPRQLEKVLLNSTMANKETTINTAAAIVDDNSILPAPNHAVLNHLATGAIKNGVLAMGTVTRYKNKYVTTLLYRPVQT
ncbi:snf1-related kinase complex anchoring protein sip1 [Malassezia pachydermatis]|uniref:Snf1-related kinase complex anchoring protein sip1 n=1 Tax=Malassezia pachydermatis TaxID=77020 RepID=A0A0M8MRM0_9BASI|nr:snf1-related kinase complex anchoring protein sip1 [Malassezia pachydermatis]KOS12934.1 snf1-related kinase complex anchoring protein sip1 [Malassezia pachydermatis]